MRIATSIHVALEKAIPLRRIAMREDIVGAIVFLANDDADCITVSGGLTMLRRAPARGRSWLFREVTSAFVGLGLAFQGFCEWRRGPPVAVAM